MLSPVKSSLQVQVLWEASSFLNWISRKTDKLLSAQHECYKLQLPPTLLAIQNTRACTARRWGTDWHIFHKSPKHLVLLLSTVSMNRSGSSWLLVLVAGFLPPYSSKYSCLCQSSSPFYFNLHPRLSARRIHISKTKNMNQHQRHSSIWPPTQNARQ